MPELEDPKTQDSLWLEKLQAQLSAVLENHLQDLRDNSSIAFLTITASTDRESGTQTWQLATHLISRDKGRSYHLKRLSVPVVHDSKRNSKAESNSSS